MQRATDLFGRKTIINRNHADYPVRSLIGYKANAQFTAAWALMLP